jgi:Flp pilus assembly protein TadD
VYERAGQLTKAVDAYAAAQRVEPDNPEYLGNLARARVRRGDNDPDTRRLLEELVLRDARPQWADWARRTLLRLNAAPPPQVPDPGSVDPPVRPAPPR